MEILRRRHGLAVLIVAAVAAGCSASHAQSAPPPTASQVTAKLQAAGLPIPQGVTIYTAATDPNHLLGRPGQYTSKTEWVDIRHFADDAECGVEVFPTAQLATRRAAYIQSLRTGGILGTEYDYLAGPVLVRVSGVLTPGEAAGYGRAVGAKLYRVSAG